MEKKEKEKKKKKKRENEQIPPFFRLGLPYWQPSNKSRAKLWNCLRPDLRKLRKKPFKNKVHQFLFVVLGDEDDYVEVSTLILKITSYH